MEWLMSGAYLEATVALILGVAGVIGWALKKIVDIFVRMGVAENRLDDQEEDARTTADILAQLVPTVAALEERTKRM